MFQFRRMNPHTKQALRFASTINKIGARYGVGVKKENISAVAGILILVALGAGLRFLPHLPNFAPIAAISLFAGVYLNKKYFFAAPILAMLLSDYFIGFYELKVMASVYFSFLTISFIGLFLKKYKNPAAILSCSLAGSLLFYLITNFAVWAFTPWYPKDLPGLLMSYTLALPFFRNTILGDLFYTGLFFGIWELYLQRHLLFAFLKRQVITASLLTRESSGR